MVRPCGPKVKPPSRCSRNPWGRAGRAFESGGILPHSAAPGRGSSIRPCSAAVPGGKCLIFVAAVLLLAAGRAEASQGRTHVVYAGQRLGSIAKRYRVSVDAICRANRIEATDPIRPGQRLKIPTDEDVKSKPGGSRERGAARTHRVKKGQRLESIARHYGVSISAICTANQIQEQAPILPGQSLIIPSSSSRLPRRGSSASETNFRKYFRTPRVRGKINLIGSSRGFRGQVFDRKGRLLPRARDGIQQVLDATGERPPPNPRLIRLLVQVSDRFGARPLRVVSGYRIRSFFNDSRHRTSCAVDFSIHGVPNAALRDYLRTLDQVGVGFYPNSSFVHLDVRSHSAYWVDSSGPGEGPRSTTPQATQPSDHSGQAHSASAGTSDRARHPESVHAAPVALGRTQIDP